MSTASLPGYAPLPRSQFAHAATPTYSAQPQRTEQRIALNDADGTAGRRARPHSEFVVHSKHGGVSLHLSEQEDHVRLPVYGKGSVITGSIGLLKPDLVESVEVKVEGTLRLRELGGGGTTTDALTLDKAVLWPKPAGEAHEDYCPPSLRFELRLPSTIPVDGQSYPLPPTYEAQLKGLPGFRAWISYSIVAVITNKVTPVPPKIKGTAVAKALNIGQHVVSTPFVYYPRTRPAMPIPERMAISTQPWDLGIVESPQWRCHESKIIAASSKASDIVTKLYLPATSIYSRTQPIPFHLIYTGDADALAVLKPFLPSTSVSAPSHRRTTKLELLRQTTVDVRNEVIFGTKTNIWRTDLIGDATFKKAGNGPNWIAYTGEIEIIDSIKVGGFKVGGFSVKDCLVLSMLPTDTSKVLFREQRFMIPIRLTTDSFVTDGTGLGANPDFAVSQVSLLNQSYDPEDDQKDPTLAQ